MVDKVTNDTVAGVINPVELLQNLIRFDTTNPPGGEAECIQYIAGLLGEAGIESTMLAKDPARPNLIARLKGRGDAPPLLLYGHVDVVTTENQDWTHPPFEANIVDGFVWGRGALDMKAGVAMMITAFLRAHAEDADTPGDVILCILSDEEAGGKVGAQYLVKGHPEQFEGVRYALGEFGGFTLSLSGTRFYPIMVSEKVGGWTKAIIEGPAGHGAMPIMGGAMSKTGYVLQRLTTKKLPVHITPPARQMVDALADGLGFPRGAMLRQVLNPTFTDVVLDALGERGDLFNALLRHTVSPTMLNASSKINVIPGRVEIGLDIRILPGYTRDDVYRELREIIGTGVKFEPVDEESFLPAPAEPDMGLFAVLADVLRKADPTGHPVPLMLPGLTDGRFFRQLGIQTYGFTPMTLPDDFKFTETIHAADERIPVEALEFGTQAIHAVLQRFGEGE